MRKLMIISSVLILFLALGGVASADLVNGGFETGDLTGWNYTSHVSVITGANVDGTYYGPVDGSYFSVAVGGSVNAYYHISQSVVMAAGDILSGHALFDGEDYMPFNDYAQVRIYDSLNHLVATPWTRTISQVGGGHTGWESWSWEALSAGKKLAATAASRIVAAC